MSSQARKALARRAPGYEIDPFCLRSQQFLRFYGANIPLNHPHFRMIGRIGRGCKSIDFDGGHDSEATPLEARCEPSATSKKFNRRKPPVHFAILPIVGDAPPTSILEQRTNRRKHRSITPCRKGD
jgi:hypothetical protein